MSVNTLVKDGILTNIQSPVKILDIKPEMGEVHYNPGLARDPEGNVFISIRSCITNQKVFEGIKHPLGYENFLHVGIFDEDSLKVRDIKEIKPDKNYPGLQWGIEDIRLFWREDGLHGIGVILPIEEGLIRLREGEILIDYEAGTYKLIKDHGRPFGHAEKNWMPSEHANEHFDFIYSPTQIVKDGEVIGEDNDLFIHNGTPLVQHEDGYISVAHLVTSVKGERTYAHVALKWNAKGRLIEQSQLFHFNVGWREQLKETIEFASGLLWSAGKEGKELLIGIGIKDELTGICKLDMDELQWELYSDTIYYTWEWQTSPNRVELTA